LLFLLFCVLFVVFCVFFFFFLFFVFFFFFYWFWGFFYHFGKTMHPVGALFLDVFFDIGGGQAGLTGFGSVY